VSVELKRRVRDQSTPEENELIRVSFNEDKVKFENVIMAYNGVFIEPEDFNEVFENADEVFEFFDSEIILGAVIDKSGKKVYFITLSPASKFESPFTTVMVWETEFK
jgi:hypothetical protein